MENDLAPVSANDAYLDEETLTKVDPKYVTALRLSTGLLALPFLVGALILEGALSSVSPLPFGVILGFVVFVVIVLLVRLPARRWSARGRSY